MIQIYIFFHFHWVSAWKWLAQENSIWHGSDFEMHTIRWFQIYSNKLFAYKISLYVCTTLVLLNSPYSKYNHSIHNTLLVSCLFTFPKKNIPKQIAPQCTKISKNLFLCVTYLLCFELKYILKKNIKDKLLKQTFSFLSFSALCHW